MLGEPGHNSLNFGKATIAGWGTTYNLTVDDQITIAPTPKQQKLDVPLLAHDQCVTKWKNIGIRTFSEYVRYGQMNHFFTLSVIFDFPSVENHICAGGEKGEGSCEVIQIIIH